MIVCYFVLFVYYVCLFSFLFCFVGHPMSEAEKEDEHGPNLKGNFYIFHSKGEGGPWGE